MDGRPNSRNKAAFFFFAVVRTLLKLFFINQGGGGYVIVLVITKYIWNKDHSAIHNKIELVKVLSLRGHFGRKCSRQSYGSKKHA